MSLKWMKSKVAAIIFVNDKKEILLCLRDDKPEIPYPNYWGLIGGHLEQGETPFEALKRETMEEIGYDINEAVFLGSLDDEAENWVYIFHGKMDKKADELYLTEGQRLEFFDYERIMKLINIPQPLLVFIENNKEKIFC